MKKIFPIFCTLLLAGGSPLWAAYAKIGDYRDVEVVNVTWRGIEVLHRDGGCILTEKDLSDADKATLKKELEQHRQLLKGTAGPLGGAQKRAGKREENRRTAGQVRE